MQTDIVEQFNQAKALIDKSERILLTMHERMDGDDGGASLAMAHYLRSIGKQVAHAIKRGVPPHLSFLPGSEHITDDTAENDFDLLITFGCATLDRTGSQHIASLSTPIVNFDHHPDNAFFGTVNVVDKNKSSVAELVYDFFSHLRLHMSRDIATCLLTGIISDTGSFMHSNTQPTTLEAAAQLMRKGALTGRIIKHTWKNKSPETLKAWGKAMENSRYDAGNRMVFSVITEEDLRELGNLPQAAFEGFVETLNTVPEAKFALFLRQEGPLIKGSLRSDPFKNVNVARIAQLFGGGGHTQAAGFSLPGKIVRNQDGTFDIA